MISMVIFRCVCVWVFVGDRLYYFSSINRAFKQCDARHETFAGDTALDGVEGLQNPLRRATRQTIMLASSCTCGCGVVW